MGPAIKSPKSLIDKIGVKPYYKVTTIELDDAKFLKRLKERTKDITEKLRKENDIIFLAAQNKDDLDKLSSLQNYIKKAVRYGL